jgi:hypothetical protein
MGPSYNKIGWPGSLKEYNGDSGWSDGSPVNTTSPYDFLGIFALVTPIPTILPRSLSRSSCGFEVFVLLRGVYPLEPLPYRRELC